MSEHDYRSYMDRIEMTGTQHDRLMDSLQTGRAPVRRGARIAHYAVAAACLALVLAAGLGVFLNSGAQPPAALAGDPTPGALPTPCPDPVTLDDQYVLSPADPFDGQTHSSPAILGVEFDSNARLPSADVAYPAGWFEKQLTREEMVYLLGGADAADAPWMLDWVGYDVTGRAVYDGQGDLWQLQLTGRDRNNEHNTFSLDLAPGALPPSCIVDPDQVTTELRGVTVYGRTFGYYGWTDENGESVSHPVYQIALLNGGAGLRYTVYNTDDEMGAHLATQAANVFTYENAIHLDKLLTYDGDIPEWRSESLTLQQAMEEEGYAGYVTQMAAHIPAGFTFESAWRELGQNRDYLHLSWTGYYTHISVTLERDPGAVEIMDVSNNAYYDERLYTIPYADSVPHDVMFGGFQDPAFLYEDLTLDVVEARVNYKGEQEEWQSRPESVDRADYRGNFSVLYPDGMLAGFDFKGVRPEEALALVQYPQETTQQVAVTFIEFTVTGAGGTTAALSTENSGQLYSLLCDGQWNAGTADCLCEYSLSCPEAGYGWLNYHAGCGTFNDTASQRSLTLSDADRETVNAMLSSLNLAVRTSPIECAPCPVESCTRTGTHLHDGVHYCARTTCAVEGCTEAGFHRHDGVCYQGCPGVCPVEGCTQTGIHLHDGVHYCARTACTVEGCTEAGFHRHNGVCYQGCPGVCPVEGCAETGLHTHNGVCYQGNGHHAQEHHGNGHH